MDDFDISSPLLFKRDEKIELITGLNEDSPTLQATAAAWAPSEAALAAADASQQHHHQQEPVPTEVNSHSSNEVGTYHYHNLHYHHHHHKPSHNIGAFLNRTNINNNESSIDSGAEDISVVSDCVRLGLVFDPTENMDLVILTPDMGGEKPPEGIHLPDLTLDTCSDGGSDEEQHPRATTTTTTTATTGANTDPFGGEGPLGPSLGCFTWGGGTVVSNCVCGSGMGHLSNWNLSGSGSSAGGEDSAGCGTNTGSGVVEASPAPPPTKSDFTAASFISLISTWGLTATATTTTTTSTTTASSPEGGGGGLISGMTTLAVTPLAASSVVPHLGGYKD